MTLRAYAERIEAATPATRERALDGLRALAVAGVVAGHWLVMALATGEHGLRITSPLVALPNYAGVSWALQMLALFFLVGGYSSARSLARAQYRPWIRARVLRLTRPVVAVTALLGLAFPVLYALGTPAGTLRTTTALVVQPLWFIAVYGFLTALTPVAVAMVRRLGVWAALPLLASVALIDALRYGPWADAMPGWLGLLTVLPGWGFGFVLGVAWAHGRLGRRGATVLAVAGGALALLLVLRLGYPVSLVGVPGSGRVNSHPPSLLVVAVAMLQCGLAIRCRERLAALLRRPKMWALVAMLNLSALTIFCWHQVSLVLLTSTGVPALHQVPDGLGWVGWRALFFPLQLALLTALVMLFRRFESPWRVSLGRFTPAAMTLAGVAAVAYGGYALVVL
jgi:peptidoglycan/LPS O-acetylase OafA/YrhL